MPTTTPKTGKKATKKAPEVVEIPRTGPPEPTESPENPPPATPEPAPAAARIVLDPFPIPPKPSIKGGYCSEAAGMAYWRSIAGKFGDRLTVYINREHPVLNRLLEHTKEEIELMRTHKLRYPIKYIDLPADCFGEDYGAEFLNRYGSGKYKVYLNDVGIKGSKEPDLQSRNVCKFFVTVYDSDKPSILDPGRPDKGLGILDWTHPENRSFVTDLRNRGIFPPNEKEAEEMAESTVVGKLVDKISDLNERAQVLEQDKLVDRIVERVNGGGAGVAHCRMKAAAVAVPTSAVIPTISSQSKSFTA